jgi:hypothetical protein
LSRSAAVAGGKIVRIRRSLVAAVVLALTLTGILLASTFGTAGSVEKRDTNISNGSTVDDAGKVPGGMGYDTAAPNGMGYDTAAPGGMGYDGTPTP